VVAAPIRCSSTSSSSSESQTFSAVSSVESQSSNDSPLQEERTPHNWTCLSAAAAAPAAAHTRMRRTSAAASSAHASPRLSLRLTPHHPYALLLALVGASGFDCDAVRELRCAIGTRGGLCGTKVLFNLQKELVYASAC